MRSVHFTPANFGALQHPPGNPPPFRPAPRMAELEQAIKQPATPQVVQRERSVSTCRPKRLERVWANRVCFICGYDANGKRIPWQGLGYCAHRELAADLAELEAMDRREAQ